MMDRKKSYTSLFEQSFLNSGKLALKPVELGQVEVTQNQDIVTVFTDPADPILKFLKTFQVVSSQLVP